MELLFVVAAFILVTYGAILWRSGASPRAPRVLFALLRWASPTGSGLAGPGQRRGLPSGQVEQQEQVAGGDGAG